LIAQAYLALPDVHRIAARFEHAKLDEGGDAGRQDPVASLEIRLRRLTGPLHQCIADDPRRLLPIDFGKGEQLPIKEGDRRGSKTVGVDHAQWRVLVAQPAPEAVKMRARVRSHDLGEVPYGVRREFPGRQHARAERPAMAPDRQIREIDDLAGQIAQAQQPIEEAAVFG